MKLFTCCFLVFAFPVFACSQQDEAKTRKQFVEIVHLIGVFQEEDLHSKLELTNRQKKKIDDWKESLTNTVRKFPRSRNQDDLSVEEVRKWRLEAGKTEKELANILLPHQQNLLGQMVLRGRAGANGMDAGLLHKEIQQRLDIENSQRKSVEDIVERGRAEIADLMKEFREFREDERVKKMKDVMKVLTPEQRKAFEKIVGEIVVLPNDKQP